MMPLPGRSDRWLTSHASRCRVLGRSQHAEPQGVTRQRSPDREHLGVAMRLLSGVTAELLGDIGDDALVGGGRGGQHRQVRRQRGDELGQSPVVGPEVVPPVRDAVRLIDDQQAHAGHERRQLFVPKSRIVEPLGRDQQDVDLVGIERRAGLLPLVRIGRVDRHGPDARPLGGGHLIAHQGQQRRHQQRGTRSALTQQQRGDEVDRRLSPPGALHHQRTAVIVDQRLDGLELAIVEHRAVDPGEALQRGGGVSRGRRARGRGHAVIVSVDSDNGRDPALPRADDGRRMSP